MKLVSHFSGFGNHIESPAAWATFAVVLLTLGARLAVSRHHGLGFDSYGHLYMAVTVTEQKVGPYGAIAPQVVHGGRYHHPFLFHYLIGKLGKARLIRLAPALNPFFEFVFLLTVSSLLLIVGVPAKIVLIALLLYASTPLWFTAVGGLGMRVAYFSPRLISELLVNSVVLITAYVPSGYWPVVLVQTLLIWATLSVSKFGVQAVILLLVPLSVLTANVGLGLATMLGFMLSVILSRGAFLDALRTQARHLAWYAQLVRKGGGGRSGGRNSLVGLLSIPAGKTLIARVRGYATKLIYGNSWTGMILLAPVVPLALVSSIAAPIDHVPPVLITAMFVSVALFALTNLRWLLFLGESERYVNHCALAFCVVAATAAAHDWRFFSLIVLCLLYGAAFWIAENRRCRATTHASADEEREIISFLRTRRPTGIASIPYHVLNPWRVMLETPHRMFFPIVSDSPNARAARDLEVPYPFPDLRRLDELNRTYGVDTVVVDRRTQRTRFPDWTPPPGWSELAASTRSLLVIGKTAERAEATDL